MMKKIFSIFRKLPVIVACLSLISTLGFASIADASGTAATSATAPNSSVSQDKLSAIISKGDSEIARRLATLNTLDTKISASTKISSADQTTLTTEVNNEISGLGTDKTNLDVATTLTAAHAAAQSIFTDYRVYALVTPQIFIIRTADRQQLVEAQLTTEATNIKTAMGASPTATQTSDLQSINTAITTANGLSVSVEKAVIALSPTDYNNDHTLLLQYYGNLKTAETSITQAISLAKTLIGTIK